MAYPGGCSGCSSTPPRRKVVELLANYNTQSLARRSYSYYNRDLQLKIAKNTLRMIDTQLASYLFKLKSMPVLPANSGCGCKNFRACLRVRYYFHFSTPVGQILGLPLRTAGLVLPLDNNWVRQWFIDLCMFMDGYYPYMIQSGCGNTKNRKKVLYFFVALWS